MLTFSYMFLRNFLLIFKIQNLAKILLSNKKVKVVLNFTKSNLGNLIFESFDFLKMYAKTWNSKILISGEAIACGNYGYATMPCRARIVPTTPWIENQLPLYRHLLRIKDSIYATIINFKLISLSQLCFSYYKIKNLIDFIFQKKIFKSFFEVKFKIFSNDSFLKSKYIKKKIASFILVKIM